MDDQNLKDLEREQADNQLIGDAFQHLLDTYLSSRHRKKVDIVTKAFNFARQAHKGVRRLSGEPYIMHPIAVAQIACEEMGLGSTSICAALLHDVVEDTSVTIEELEKEFPTEVTDALRLLTHIKGTDYFEYVRSIRQNPIAKAVKLADIAHNSDETRLSGSLDVSEEKKAYLRNKYVRARKILEEG